MMAKAAQLGKAEAQASWSPKVGEAPCTCSKCGQESHWVQACPNLINQPDHVQGAIKEAWGVDCPRVPSWHESILGLAMDN